MSIININLDNVQETLVSGTNIKTINGVSILGSGNIIIQGVSFGTSGQIPFMNGTDDDFSYSSGLNYSGSELFINGNFKAQLSGQTGWDFTIQSVGSNTHKIGGGNTLIIEHGNLFHSGSSEFAYGSSNKYVCIGTNIQVSNTRLYVKGGGSTSATTTLLLRNSSDTDLMKVTDEGYVGIGTTSPLSTLDNNGSEGVKSTQVTSSTYTATDTDNIIYCDDDTAGSAMTITLPAVATCLNRVYTIYKKGTTANVIIDGSGSETINGSLTFTLLSQYESIKIHCDGTEWFIIEA